ncbi:nrgA [Symbiodinium sp. CCMP2456]|nr:nrgA [Symbiodinium sp. CCMP2456]
MLQPGAVGAARVVEGRASDLVVVGDFTGLAFASFQMTFAIIASAIISGSLVERVRFSAYCIMLALWSLLIYAPLCHWVWGPGSWIGQLGALDFAGGTVVHISSGVSGLVAGAILGPRKHVEKDMGPANAPFVILGGCLLWFGWLGFNGGSALSTTDGVAARAVATTFVAAASSMLTWLALERVLKGKSTSVGASVGAVAGLVVITPAAGFVTPGWSIAIGALGAPWCYLTVEAVNRINLVDDTLDAFGLHGSGGFAGAILTGIFAVDEGLIYSGSFVLLGKQIAGALAGVAFSAVGTAIIMGVMKMLFKLRIPEDQEIGGVDEHTHGESYHSSTKTYSAGGRMTESETSKESAPAEDQLISECGASWIPLITDYEPSPSESRSSDLCQVSAFASNVVKWSHDASVGEYARVAQSTAHQLALFAGGGSVTNLVGVDVASGDVRYCVDTGIGAVWSLCASGEPLRVLCGGSWTRPTHTAEVSGFDAMSGEKLFALDPGVGRYIVSTALRDGGTAFVSGENGMVVALDTATGEVKFRSDSMVEEVWSLEVASELGLILCSGGWSEKVSALDMRTGELRWGPVNATIGKVFSFQLVDSILLCGGADGLLAGIDPGSGDLRFTLAVNIGEIWSLAYDPKSRTLFCGGNNESVAAVQL